MSRIDGKLQNLIDKGSAKKRPSGIEKEKPKEDLRIDPTRFHELSESELVAIARHLGHTEGPRALHRDDVIALLLGESDVDSSDPLTEVRNRMYAFVEDNRTVTVSRAYSRCDLDCPRCHHSITVDCFVSNRDLI